MRRLRWFGAGVAAGAVGAVYVFDRLRELRGQGAADLLAERAVGLARRAGSAVAGAYAEGVDEMRSAEERIAADLDERERRRTGLS